jgi:hypothetical protein
LFVSPFVSVDVDLTATAGDYHSNNRLDPEDYNWFASNVIKDKYVNKSTLVTQREEHEDEEKRQSVADDQAINRIGYYVLPLKKRHYPQSEKDDDSVLLNSNNDECLIPLHLTRSSHGSLSSTQSSVQQVNDIKQSSSLKRKQDFSSVLLSNDVSDNRNTSCCSIFPSNDQALKVLRADIKDSSSEGEGGCISDVQDKKRARMQTQTSFCSEKSNAFLVDFPVDLQEVRKSSTCMTLQNRHHHS